MPRYVSLSILCHEDAIVVVSFYRDMTLLDAI